MKSPKSESDVCLYAERDPSKLEPYYTRHVEAMTNEKLHAKSDVAAELAWRDMQIALLRKRIRELDYESNLEPVAETFDPHFIVTDKDGFCKSCGRPYLEGDQVWWLGPGRGAECYECREDSRETTE